MTENSKVLIVSFDGLDKDLIEKYNLENIPQKEFGTIDNQTGIKVTVTSELFASFITGKTWREHGIVGLDIYRNPVLRKIESLNKYSAFRKFTGLRKSFYNNMPFLDSKSRHVVSDDLPVPTIFDELDKSKAIGVRAYSKGYTVDLMGLMEEFGVKEAVKELNRWENSKKTELFGSLEENHDLVMAHFHKPDYIHHWFWEVGKMDKVRETYYEMDELAGEILEKAEEKGFDTVIFMSDHGVPDVENGGHNKNAFYSCNRELFGEKTPHITDFHDKILEFAGSEGDIDGVDL